MAKMIFENPANGYRETVDGSTIAGAFFLGPLYLLAKGLWTHAFIWTSVATLLIIVAAPFILLLIPIYAALVPSLMKANFLRKGWVEVTQTVSSEDATDTQPTKTPQGEESPQALATKPSDEILTAQPIIRLAIIAAVVIALIILASRTENVPSSSEPSPQNQPETEPLIQAVIELNPKAPASPFSSDARLDFPTCKSRVDATAVTHYLPTSTVMDNDLIYVVRFPMSEGSVLASCSSKDNKLVVTRTPGN